MKSPLLSLIFFVGALAGLDAQELRPYDNLSRNNVRLKADFVSGGSAVTGQPLKTNYGTYIKDVSSSKTVEVTLSFEPKAEGFILEAYGFLRQRGGRGVRGEKLEVTMDGPTKYHFTMSADRTRERWMYAEYGRVSEHGESIAGWCVRAISGGQVIGVAGSGPQFEQFAKSPGDLNATLGPK